MTDAVDVDPLAEQQISTLPPPALEALAEAITVLEPVPWNGLSINSGNPKGAVGQLPFGQLGQRRGRGRRADNFDCSPERTKQKSPSRHCT